EHLDNLQIGVDALSPVQEYLRLGIVAAFHVIRRKVDVQDGRFGIVTDTLLYGIDSLRGLVHLCIHFAEVVVVVFVIRLQRNRTSIAGLGLLIILKRFIGVGQIDPGFGSIRI